MPDLNLSPGSISTMTMYNSILEMCDQLIYRGNLLMDRVLEGNAMVRERLLAIEQAARANAVTRVPSAEQPEVLSYRAVALSQPCSPLSLSIPPSTRAEPEVADDHIQIPVLSPSDKDSDNVTSDVQSSVADFPIELDYDTDDQGPASPLSIATSLSLHPTPEDRSPVDLEDECSRQTSCANAAGESHGRLIPVRKTDRGSLNNPQKKRKRSNECESSSRSPTRRMSEAFGAYSDLDCIEQLANESHQFARGMSVPCSSRETFLLPGSEPFQLVEALPSLVQELGKNELADRLAQLKHRVDLAHFFWGYQDAHENHLTFLETTQEYAARRSIPLRAHTGRADSIVKQRLIDIAVWQWNWTREKASCKIHKWNTEGRPWAELITRLGYGALLLVPPIMTNDSVHKMPQKKFQCLVNAIEARKPMYADALERANGFVKGLSSYMTIPEQPSPFLNLGESSLLVGLTSMHPADDLIDASTGMRLETIDPAMLSTN